MGERNYKQQPVLQCDECYKLTSNLFTVIHPIKQTLVQVCSQCEEHWASMPGREPSTDAEYWEDSTRVRLWRPSKSANLTNLAT